MKWSTGWRPRAWVSGLVLSGLVLLAPAHAQDRNALVRALTSGSDFRVRVQAAFAMGNSRDATYRSNLERALRDSNPAVRAAAATALGRLGSRSALSALRRAQRDSSAAVRLQAERSIRTLSASTATAPSAAPRARTSDGFYAPAVTIAPSADQIPWPRIRYVVVLGDMTNRSTYRSRTLETHLRNEVHRALRLLRGVAVFTTNSQLDARARREIRRRNLPTLQLDGNITKIQRRRARSEINVRAEVSLMLLDEGNIRSTLNGAATGAEAPRRDQREQTNRLAQQALAAAVRSAMSSVPTALVSASR